MDGFDRDPVDLGDLGQEEGDEVGIGEVDDELVEGPAVLTVDDLDGDDIAPDRSDTTGHHARAPGRSGSSMRTRTVAIVPGYAGEMNRGFRAGIGVITTSPLVAGRGRGAAMGRRRRVGGRPSGTEEG